MTVIDYSLSVYGENARAFKYRGPELMLAGPSDTGKTFALLGKMHGLAWKYRGASLVVLRKQLTDTYSTAIRTFTEKIWQNGDREAIETYGGEKPQWFDYPTGTRIWVAGLDKAGKVLSAEHDVIYVNQAEELTLADWETLTTRATGRAGNMPYAQVIGDCNPAGSTHWIIRRAKSGYLKYFKSRHQDNPELYNQETGELTEEGAKRLERLKALTGHRYKRLFLGEWASPEGLVYERFSTDNVTELAEYDPERGAVELAVDDGFAASPRVILFVQMGDDGVVNVFDEMYHKRHLAAKCIEEARERLTKYDEDIRISIAVCDPSAVQLIAEMQSKGIPARPAKGCKIEEGIKLVEKFIRDEDGRVKLCVHPRCTNFIYEMSEGYAYPDASRAGDLKPVKIDDHGPDAIRYWCWKRARRGVFFA